MANPPARARWIILGASNVALGVSQVMRLLPQREVWGAFGHGRSYGIETQLLGRAYPGIADSPLWDRLAAEQAEEACPLSAVITDVGNDLMYDVDPVQLLDWIDTALERLSAHDVRVVITGLPLDSVRRLRPAQFWFFSRLFFPERRHELEDILEKVEAVDRGLRARCAASDRLDYFEMRGEWYGLDPIHTRRSQRPRVWHQILSQLDPTLPAPGNARSAAPWRYWGIRPESWEWIGQPKQTEQPCRILRDGSTLRFY